MNFRGDYDFICGCIAHMKICEHSLHVPNLIYSHIAHMQIRGHSLHAFLKMFLLLTCGHIAHMQICEMHPESCS